MNKIPNSSPVKPENGDVQNLHNPNLNGIKISPELEKLVFRATKGQPEGIQIQAQQMLRQHHYSGPIPSPDDLKAFKAVWPDSIERIFNMAEKEQQMRKLSQEATIRKTDSEAVAIVEETKISSKIASAQISQSKAGLWIVTFLMFSFLGACTFFLYIDKPGAASFFAIGSLISILAVFYRYVPIPTPSKKK